jgi:hypothetical protein
MKQTTFASASWEKKGKITRRERFLAEMDCGDSVGTVAGADRAVLSAAGNGRQPHPMERMLRIYFMQNWFNLSDPQAEDSLYDIESMRRFAGIELAEDVIPDETTILRFRHLLEEHRLTEGIFAEVRALLEERWLLLKSGTIMDRCDDHCGSTLDEERRAGERSEMRQGKKGKDWHFGMKAHVGTDRRSIVPYYLYH